MREETKEPEKLLCPKAGTATSSPAYAATFQSFKIVNTMLWFTVAKYFFD
jgi:hypothetical protein